MRIPAIIGLAALSTAALCQPYVWDFEGEEVTWRPRAATVTVERVEGVGAHEDSTAALRVHGPIDTGWNYALSDRRPMEGGRLYRLSAWLRVDGLGEGSELPFLKCEFVAGEPGREVGRANTGTYRREQMGQWQQLQAEFRAPEGTAECWIALEKGGNRPMEIDAYLDDIRIEEIDELSLLTQHDMDPLPEALEAARGVRPRVYLNSALVSRLQEAVETTHAGMWGKLRAQADAAVRSGPPAYRDDDGWSGQEQLWQREVGNRMPVLAMAWVLSGEEQYLHAARDWALASCGYPTWGLGRIDGMDLATGHQLLGLALVYDWCYADLEPEARETIRETLVERAGAMFEAGATRQIWWHRAYLQNHLWVNACGVAAAGLALFDEVPQASRWVGYAREQFRRTMETLGDDGASHEGVGYWQYGAEYLLKFMHLAREMLDEDMYDHEWWRNTADYWLYMTVPRDAWRRDQVLVDIADCPRGNWYGPEHILRALAAEYRDPHAQWSAAQVDEANIEAASARWLNLIWYEPTLEPRHPGERPTLHHFGDMDIVSARSDWSGAESLVVHKCGPYIGHKAIQEFDYDPGGGHVHPDTNHFVVFGAGQWLIRDDGYRAKWTGHHNTLLVDGAGQLGEGRQWFTSAPLAVRARPRIVQASAGPELDHITGDATEAYPREAGLTRFVRHLLFVKPSVLLVIDDIAAEGEREFELRLHPEEQEGIAEGEAFVFRGEAGTIRIEPLTTEGVTASAEPVAGEGRSGREEFVMFTVRLRKQADAWRNAVALSWARAGSEPPRVALEATPDEWRFAVDGATVLFRWADGHARVVR